MHRLRTVCLFSMLVLLSASKLVAASKLTLEEVMNWPVVAVPSVSYSPETNWCFGAGGSGFFALPTDSLGRHSEVSFDGAYTLNKQWYVNLSSTLYLTDRWQLRCKVGYRNYPDVFYGIGDQTDTLRYTSGDMEHHIALPKHYTSRQFSFMAEPLYRVGRHWWLGMLADVRYDATGVEGRWAAMRLSATAMLDTRDVLYYPTHGMLFKSQIGYRFMWFDDCTLSMVGGLRATVDFRHFVRIYNQLVFAYQVYGDIVYGSSDVVPELLPTLGGQDMLRGVRRNVYRDNTLLCVQGELRIPIWRIFRAAVFAGVGDVYDVDDWQWHIPKVGYGVGLRCTFNQAGINLRFDVARNNIDKAWNEIDNYSFYFTIKEAF